MAAYGAPIPIPAPTTRPDNSAAYANLPLDGKSLRLLQIEPATAQYGGLSRRLPRAPHRPIVCRLTVATFSSRPRFEALSYMWGTDAPTREITVNGKLFLVQDNLYDALRYLRTHRAQAEATTSPTCFWIDAVCINQQDDAERSSQVRMMDQMYFRAAIVVVWLGARHADASNLGQDAESQSHWARLVKGLNTDPYWERLWILQEIGLADSLRVCYGQDGAESWAGFMSMLAGQKNRTRGPLKLDAVLRQDGYGPSRTLKNLMWDHRHAKCKDSRDRIYGLLGLAHDAADFPVGYDRSLAQVWEDTMSFLVQKNMVTKGSEALMYAQLVKALVIGHHGDPLDGLTPKMKFSTNAFWLEEDTVFRMEAVIVGVIEKIGPMVGNLVSGRRESTESWSRLVQKSFRDEDSGVARSKSDQLMRALLECDNSTLKRTAFSRVSPVMFGSPKDGGSYSPYAFSPLKPYGPDLSSAKSPSGDGGTFEARTYVAKNRVMNSSTDWRLGVATGRAKPNDLVVWVRGLKRAMLVRAYKSPTYVAVLGKPNWNKYYRLHVVGTALVAGDIAKQRSRTELDRRWQSWVKSKVGVLEVKLDPSTIYMLLD